VRLHLILDSESRIVATVPSGVQETNQLPKRDEPSEEVAKVEIRPVPLPGQTVHEVELPRELEGLSGVELHNALMGYQVQVGEAKLVQLVQHGK
jgi:hypothetical protein